MPFRCKHFRAGKIARCVNGIPHAKVAAMAHPPRGLTHGFARAIAELEARGMDRRAIATALGVRESTVSRWVTGDRSVSVEKLPEVDQLCGQPLGHVLRLAGYVKDGIDLVAAIEAAPELDEPNREDLLLVYEVFRRRSTPAATDSETPPTKLAKRSRRSSKS